MQPVLFQVRKPRSDERLCFRPLTHITDEGTARFSSPLNVLDFLKITNISVWMIALIKAAGEAAVTIARAEGLDAHASGIELRMKNVGRNSCHYYLSS